MSEEVKFHLGVKAIIRNEHGKILLLKIRPDTLLGYSGSAYWDVPGGRIQWDSVIRDESRGQVEWESSILATLAREIEEETGLIMSGSVTPFSFVISNVSYPVRGGEIVGLILRSYLFPISDVKEIILSGEHSEYGWFAPLEASNLLEVKFPREFCDCIASL